MARNSRYRDTEYQEYGENEAPVRGSRQSGSVRYADDRYDGSYDDRYDDGQYDGEYESEGYYDDSYEDGGYDDRYDDGNDTYSEESYDDYGSSYAQPVGESYDDGYDAQGGYDDGYDQNYGGYEEEDDYEEVPGKNSRGRKASSGRKSSSGRKETDPREARKRKKRNRRIILFIVEILVLLAVLGLFYFSSKVKEVGKVSLDDVKLEAHMSEEVIEQTTSETGTMRGYRNIALFGVDSTKGELGAGNTRSDSIMIASINLDTGDLRLVSIYRDTYLNLGNDTYNKCNGAYAKGGPEQAVNMLNMNLDMNITDFITVGFGGLTHTIDRLGGLDVDVDSAEISHLNNYQLTMSQELGYPYQQLTSTGMQHLNGLQCTAYCRIRYTAGDDFKRAARQREILMAVIEKAKKADVATLNAIATDVFSEIYTSLDLSEILDLLSEMSSYNVAGEDGFPDEEMRTTGIIKANDCVFPKDLAGNVVWLHEFLFDDKEYEISGRVRECSDRIASDLASIGGGR